MSDIMSDDHGPISHVHEGMRVVDSTGAEIGTVDDVRLGDAAAVTSEGQRTPEPGGFGGAVTRIVAAAHELPDGAGERLTREGYLRVDAKGLFSGHRYAAADEVAGVDGDTVTLTVPRDQLVG